MYQKQNSWQLSLKHKSITFTQTEILDRVFNSKHKSHESTHFVHLKNSGFQNAGPCLPIGLTHFSLVQTHVKV